MPHGKPWYSSCPTLAVGDGVCGAISLHLLVRNPDSFWSTRENVAIWGLPWSVAWAGDGGSVNDVGMLQDGLAKWQRL